MKKFLFSLLLFYSIIFGQPQKNFPSFVPTIPFETEVITIPRTDGDYTIYFTYKIPYRLLVFERHESSYTANFRIIVEISDVNAKLIDRDIKDSKITVNNFDATSEQKLFLQDFLEFKLKPDNYRVAAIISDRNSTGERPLKPVELILKKEEQEKKEFLLHPLVINPSNVNCNDQSSILFSNTGGNIPHSPDQFDLVIPVIDTSLSSIEVILDNNGDSVFSVTIEESFIEAIGIIKCGENILISKTSENSITRNFIIKNINEKLNEGEIFIKISNEENDLDESIKLQVIWFNKPISLLNPEKAIELLIYIDSENVVEDLLSSDESDYPEVLRNYWAKFDPTPETAFNEIMFEYYSRVDYAATEFNSITNSNGAKSDRGMVYIKFGKPDKSERTSNATGEIIEVWTYSGSQIVFTFVDKIGTGNFKLTEN